MAERQLSGSSMGSIRVSDPMVNGNSDLSPASSHDRLMELIEHSFAPPCVVDLIRPESDLQSLGVLDSLSFIDLIAGIEDLFDIVIEEGDMERDNFISIASIVSFVERRRSGDSSR